MRVIFYLYVMKSRTEENYLKALFMLSQKDTDVSVNELSKVLDIKMPTVTAMMKKFAEKQWVFYESYKPIRLTDNGRKEAAQIVRKHRLTEMFLAEVMGLGWENVHEIAEQIEHIKSQIFFDKMDEMLNFPKIDPHGSPIPDKSGEIQILDFTKLSDCEMHDKVVFRAVEHASDDFLKFLNDRNLQLGKDLKIKKIESFDKSMTIRYDKKNYVFSQQACEMMLVEKLG